METEHGNRIDAHRSSLEQPEALNCRLSGGVVCVLSPFLFPVVIDVFTELTRDGVLSELLNDDGFVLMS